MRDLGDLLRGADGDDALVSQHRHPIHQRNQAVEFVGHHNGGQRLPRLNRAD